MSRAVLPVLLVTFSGCAAIIDSLLDPYPSVEEQQKFEAELDASGVSGRERCRRRYDYHKDWARDFSECRGFVDSLEAMRAAVEKGDVEVRKAGAEVKKGGSTPKSGLLDAMRDSTVVRKP